MLVQVACLTLLLGVSQAEFTWHRLSSDYPRENIQLTGHSIKEIHNVEILTQCALHCLHTPECKSYNLDQDAEVCTLNDATEEDAPEDIRETPVSLYAQRDSYAISEVNSKSLSKRYLIVAMTTYF